MPKFTLGDIVARLGGELIGDPSIEIVQIATLEAAGPGHLSFLTHGKYRKQLAGTRASAVILGPDARDATGLPRIVIANPYAYFARALALLNPEPKPEPGVHPSAVVESSARIDPGASIGPLSYIGKDVRIGAGTVIGAGCSIGDGASLGEDCLVYPRVSIYHGCVVGNRVILHSGAVIGADGFGLAHDQGRWVKIPQIGRVVLGDDVEVGANTTIDRGALDDTVIGEGVKLDNQIQIAHNVRIGEHTAMAGCSAVAGSARIGAHCTVGGRGSILGHLEIADHVNVSTCTLITKSIKEPGTYTSALPFAPHAEWLRTAAHLRQLDRLADRIRSLEQKLAEQERNDP